MNEDRSEGIGTITAGKAETNVGKAIRDRNPQSDGLMEKASGSAGNLFGRTQQTVRPILDQDPSEGRDGQAGAPLINQDRVEGAATTLRGRLESNVGELIGDRKLETDGLIAKARGTAQNLFGGAQDAVRTALDQAAPEVRDGAQKAIAAARRNPLIATLAVGAIGLIMGRFVGRSAASGGAGRTQAQIAEEALTLRQIGERR